MLDTPSPELRREILDACKSFDYAAIFDHLVRDRSVVRDVLDQNSSSENESINTHFAEVETRLPFLIRLEEEYQQTCKEYEQLGFLKEGDAPFPAMDDVLQKVMQFFVDNEHAQEGFRYIKKPKLIFSPIFEEEGGVVRMFKILEPQVTKRGEYAYLGISDDLKKAWEIDFESPEKNTIQVVAWNIAIMESAIRPYEVEIPCSKSYLGRKKITHYVEHDRWMKQFGRPAGLESPTKEQYAFAQMSCLLDESLKYGPGSGHIILNEPEVCKWKPIVIGMWTREDGLHIRSAQFPGPGSEYAGHLPVINIS